MKWNTAVREGAHRGNVNEPPTTAKPRTEPAAQGAIRTITDPKELAQARLDEVRAGNAAMREKIRTYRAILKAGIETEKQLRTELAEISSNHYSSEGNEGGA